MENQEKIRLAEEARFKCVNFTMKGAKKTIMIACVGDEEATLCFSKVLEAKNKVDFLDRLDGVSSLASQH